MRRDRLREAEVGRDAPGGLTAWSRGHIESTAKVLGVWGDSKAALVKAVLAVLDAEGTSGGAPAGLGCP